MGVPSPIDVGLPLRGLVMIGSLGRGQGFLTVVYLGKKKIIGFAPSRRLNQIR